MILPILLIILISGCILSLTISKWSDVLPRYIALLTLASAFVLLLKFWNLSAFPVLFKSRHGFMLEYSTNWISVLNTSIHLGIDGLSYIMILLTLFMGFIAILISEKTDHEGFYYFNTLLMIFGITGIFLAVDLFLFFFFWEMMLLPIYLLMVINSKEDDSKTSFRFFVYTQASGLILLLSLLILYIIRGKEQGWFSFDFFNLTGTFILPKISAILLIGFLLAFFVKLPVFPVHGWLPRSFVVAPVTAIVAGLLIKTGAYGIIRFAVPLFPEGSIMLANWIMALGVITIIFGAFMAYTQTDLRLIAAYSGISHMGFILIGLFSFQTLAWQGVIIQMIASAISTSALLMVAFALLRRTGTCNINQMGGLWEKVPVLSGLGLFFAIASLGLPGLGNFIAEFMILAGVFKVNILVSILASVGLIAAVAYSLRIVQKIFVGNKNSEWNIPDLSWIEKIVLGSLVVVSLWIGLYPKPIIDRTKTVIENVLNRMNSYNKLYK
jgi:NADH-quinone oxidoreductase subunit M